MLDHARRPRPLLRHMLGDVLRRTRLAQGRTLADVARAARVSMPYLSELERGRKEASSEVLAAICDALRIELYDLLAQVGRDLSSDRTRRPAPVRPGPAAGDVTAPPVPASPRALADVALVLADGPSVEADAEARASQASVLPLPGSAQPRCLLAA